MPARRNPLIEAGRATSVRPMKRGATMWMAAALLAAPLAAEAQPRRIVSLDYCADQFVLGLADREQIAAVSRGATRDDSYFRTRAAGIRRTRGTLENVVALRPDLVVRSWSGVQSTERLQRLGFRVLQVGEAESFAGVRNDVTRAAHAFGQEQRGEAILRDLDSRLGRLRSIAPARRPDVMYLTSGGASAGPGTLVNDVITVAGGRNIERQAGWNVLPLERMMAQPPRIVALGFFDTGLTRTTPWTYARHPALTHVLEQARQVRLRSDTISCSGWFAIDAAEQLNAVIRAL